MVTSAGMRFLQVLYLAPTIGTRVAGTLLVARASRADAVLDTAVVARKTRLKTSLALDH